MSNPYTFVNWGLLGEGKEPVLERREEYVLEYAFTHVWDDISLRDVYLYNFPIYSINDAKDLITKVIIDKIHYHLFEREQIYEIIELEQMICPYTIEIMGKTLEIPDDLEFYVGQYIDIDDIKEILMETKEKIYQVGNEDRVYRAYTGNWLKGPLTTLIHKEINTIDEYIQDKIKENAVGHGGVELMRMELYLDWERDIEGVYLNKIQKGGI